MTGTEIDFIESYIEGMKTAGRWFEMKKRDRDMELSQARGFYRGFSQTRRAIKNSMEIQ